MKMPNQTISLTISSIQFKLLSIIIKFHNVRMHTFNLRNSTIKIGKITMWDYAYIQIHRGKRSILLLSCRDFSFHNVVMLNIG